MAPLQRRRALLCALLLLGLRQAAAQATPSPSPTAPVPVDTTADFSCASAQPTRGSLYFGKYNATGAWSPFSTCSSADPVVSGPTWWEPSTSGS